MTVKKAKKILKETMSDLHLDRKKYKSVTWLHKRKVFRCVTTSGQVELTLF